MLNRQNQEAGPNSNQLQANDITVYNVGIDEKRAREICDEKLLQLKSEYSQEALVLANTRIKEFENALMQKMQDVDGALEAFADPSFQLLLVEAQRTAASTEREADYDLLSELLLHRFIRGDNRKTRAGISRAVEIVDEIADDALLAMTVFHSVSYFFPVTGHINGGIDALDGLFGKLFYTTLPTGHEWLEHLDILNAVRINNLGGLKNIQQFYSENLPGYIDVGIEKESKDYNTALKILHDNGIPTAILIEHELNKKYMRLALTNITQIEESTILQRDVMIGGIRHLIPIVLTDQQKIRLREVYHMYSNDDVIKNENITRFIEEWDKRINLRILRDWWDKLDINIKLTSVGTVLAHSNAQRCDKNLPPLN